MKRCPIALIVMVLAVGVGYAHTYSTVEETCPLCGEEFKCEVDRSGTQLDTRLDLKPLGLIAAPWRVPVCPRCHFVFYDEEIPAEELAKCRSIVQEDAYKKQSGRASYFLLGLLYEGLKKDPLEIGHVFLKASWQEEPDEKKLKEDLERSLKHFEAYLKEPPKPKAASEDEEDEGQPYEVAQILKGELLRRLGRFDEANSHLAGLQKLEAFQGTFLADIVRFEIDLCSKKDSQPHKVSEAKSAEDKAEDQAVENEQEP